MFDPLHTFILNKIDNHYPKTVKNCFYACFYIFYKFMHASNLLSLKTALLWEKSICELDTHLFFDFSPVSAQIIKLCAVDGILKC